MNELILSLLADDRPGIVKQVAAIVHANGGNWMESRMTQMAGKFAGIARITCETASIEALIAAMDSLKAEGIRVTVDQGQELEAPTRTYVAVQITANDRPGIVKEVADCLAALQINLEDLQTDCSTAAMSSGPMFHASFLTVIPEHVTVDEVIAALEDLSDDLMVDIDAD